jgi:hypothetical protein
LLLLGFGILGLAGAIFEHGTSDRVLLGLVALIFGTIGLASFRQGRRGERIDFFDVTDDGIRHAKAGLIAWDEIEDVRIYSISGQRALGIWTRDPDLVAKRLGKGWLRAISRLNRLVGYAPISFTNQAIPVDETYAEIQRRRRV